MSVARPLPIGFYFFLETSAIGFAKITCMEGEIASKQQSKRSTQMTSND